MRTARVPCLRILVALLSLLAYREARAEDHASAGLYERMYDSLMHLTPDGSMGTHVTQYVLRRDASTFTLEDGRLFVCTPKLNDRVCAMVFVGKGTFSFAPPTDVEREQLYRFYEKRSLNESFSTLFLLFTDSTFGEISRRWQFGELPVTSGLEGVGRECLRYVSDDDGKYFNPYLMGAFLEGSTKGLFFAHVTLEGSNDPMMFMVNPSDVEEITLMKRARSLPWHRYPEIVNKFHKEADYAVDPKGITEGKRPIDVTRYRIACTMTDGLDFSAATTIDFRAEAERATWMSFILSTDLEVDSVFSANGRRLEYFKQKSNPILWIRLPEPLGRGDSGSATVWYHGDILARDERGYIGLKAPDDWYPRPLEKQKAEFEIIYHTPANMMLVSAGMKMSDSASGDVQTSRWISTKPMRNASFNIGYFKDVDIKGKALLPVRLYVTERGDLEENVADDVLNSVTFFDKVFGAAPMTTLSATEIPYSHGEAFPGLIHLSTHTFQNSDLDGFNHVFRGHEVAHQWWGIGVDFRTYHDQWLSEGFADYAGLMYLQAAYKDNDKFFDMLRQWKQDILGNRKYLFGSGQESGPVSLGYRTESSESRGDYNLIIYKKGAWILHMLRNMLLDLQTMKEDKFNAMMKEFYTAYLDKEATSTDFQRVVERYARGDMGWFFAQWLDGTAIPKYIVSHREEKAADGKFIVHYRIRQQNVPEDFQMVVPLFVDFGDGRHARLRILAKGPLSEFDLPPMPLSPEKIIFNDLESVLCEVEYEDYK